ncbi:hypothetical protein LQF60_09040 [Tetragenococcus koreensis]|uniref:hypothetical protein n=1 Tax=Tetragenococcus koreensis TaxID=290335 RepID=UPI001F3AF064|nr:hypothetical protein [Tetragenococcus koreensis]MCF1585710.1 hypothetical protein [Tetragenococcus koreensis]MCF1615343.1 hypothetical protein [Tetragenococcus koreensis]MCF1625140.1 hypothetical protein [Tetragenococcus koreensis]MCF1629976.1 hypothetical protein [Tetragenococcus koreensis]MCF1642870.1 hypothetical protein [Tetragenococcus koreensis]
MNRYQTATRIQQELGISLELNQIIRNDLITEKEYQNVKTAIIKLANSYLTRESK